ncbi:uncharacterized protein JCM6883_003360 [Sporobolomyces salmoneus]|uniref:uncharacterized protein n=1 Tax=Sporobolomyces salmoneus TaxID=183962 RepID=UPI00317823BA
MSTSAPPKPIHLTQAQKNLIRSTPIHREIKHRVYSILAISSLGFLITLLVVVLGCVAAGPLIESNRWLVFHYVLASLFAALWLAYSLIYYRDVKFGAWSDQLKIDGGWISFVVVFSSSFLFYLYYKLRTLATVESLGENCFSTCESDLRFIKLGPLLVGIGNLVLLCVQIALLVLLFRNPIVNPPLDEHGMPQPINPLDGTVMPLDSSGQPILPPELRPVPTAKVSKKKTSVQKGPSGNGRRRQEKAEEKGPPEWESEVSDASSNNDVSEEEKQLLEKKRSSLRELGRSRRSGNRREKRSNR